MTRWNDRAITDALQALAQDMGNQNKGEAAGAIEYQGLDRFQRNNPLLSMEDTTLMVLRIG